MITEKSGIDGRASDENAIPRVLPSDARERALVAAALMSARAYSVPRW